MIMSEEGDDETFNIARAGEYFYIAAKSILEDLEIDYKSLDTTIFDLSKTDDDKTFKLEKRILKKK